MDLNDLLKIGASMIQKNDDKATSGIDMGDIANALSGILGSKGSEGGLDLGAIVSKVSSGDLGEIVSSWIGSGENKPIEPEKVSELVGEDKIKEFAEKLGVSEESARKALADALPEVVDKATPEGSSMLDDILAQVGGAKGAMDMLGKIFG